MPYVKSIPVRSTVHKTLKYILNPDKTEGLLYTASINCMTSPTDAYLEMKSVFESFATEWFDAPPPKKGKGSVKAIHYIQSFDPKDNITPELAHRMVSRMMTHRYWTIFTQTLSCALILEEHDDDRVCCAIMFALAVKNNDSDGKKSGLITMVAGFIVAALCTASSMFDLFI